MLGALERLERRGTLQQFGFAVTLSRTDASMAPSTPSISDALFVGTPPGAGVSMGATSPEVADAFHAAQAWTASLRLAAIS
jgi:hypothetical protein